VRAVGVALLALTCAQGCSSHRRPDVSPAGHWSNQQTLGSTIEAQDSRLGAALLELRVAPSAAAHRAAAEEYRRLGVLDTAFDHLTAATRLDPRDAAAYDARARIWRDWGVPAWGLGDAQRAVYYAPSSATAHNTLGTLLAALGNADGARQEFEKALALDPSASFARANLCQLGTLAGNRGSVPVGCNAESFTALKRSTR
jgi:tetratricopeptide (TPR) repeat protein